MEISTKMKREKNRIKVNKKQKSINTPTHLNSDDILLLNEQQQKRNFTKNLNISEMNNLNYISESGINNNYITDSNYPLTSTNKNLKYSKINISKKFNKSDKKKNNTTIKNKKYKKKIIEDNIREKKTMYKTESQYPLNKKNRSYINSPIIKPLSSKHFDISKKINFNERTDFRKKKNNTNDDNNNSFLNNQNNNKPINSYSRLTFNKLRHNFYKPLKKEFKDIRKTENLSNSQSFENYHNFQINNNSLNEKYINEIDNNHNNQNNQNNNNPTNNNLINIYKNKLINIFVRWIKTFFDKYSKKYYNELINKLRQNLYNNIQYNKQYINMYGNKIEEEYQINDKPNFFYIKKNKMNPQYNNIPKPLSVNKNISSIMMYKKAIKNNDAIIKNDLNSQYFLNKKNIENTENEVLSKNNSSQNLYIPAKNRNIYYNYLPRPKDSIFNELKINKSSRLFEMYNPNIYQSQNINTQINNYYNTNNRNYYINKINSFNSVMTIEKQKPKIFISKNNQLNVTSSPESKKKPENVKCSIFKCKTKNNVFYKKILTEHNNKKDNDNNYYNNINLIKKKLERIYNNNTYKNKDNINNSNQNHTFSLNNKYNYNSNENNKNYFSTIENYTNDNEEKFLNNNNTDISNDINNYNLEDIDKPMNIISMKNDNDNENDSDNDIDNDKDNNNDNNNNNNNINDNKNKNEEENINNEDNEIKNIIQMITSDRRLFLNFNYLCINKNKYIKNTKNFNNIYLFYNNSFSILGIPKKENINNNVITNISDCDLSYSNNNISEETPENINRNLNKYIKNRKTKSGLIIIDNLVNDIIYEYKSIFLNNFKKRKLLLIIHKIIQNNSMNIIKKYFDIFKDNINNKKEEPKILLYKRISSNIKKKNNILDKKNINCIIDDNKIKDIDNINNKEQLKNLINQISINNNNNEKENLHNINNIDENNKYDIKVKKPLWKSVQDIQNVDNNNIKKAKTIYLKKKIKAINNNSLNKDDDINNNSIFQKKIEIFRAKLINYLFQKK